MLIKIEKFGTILLSRQAGKEAALACRVLLRDLKKNEKLELDFDGVLTFSPAWGDEFLAPLQGEYGERLVLKNTENPSAKITLETLESISGKKFNIAS